jgi:hypothetical protein
VRVALGGFGSRKDIEWPLIPPMNKFANVPISFGIGKPEGRAEEFWHLAEQDLVNEDRASTLRTPDNL